MLKKILIGIVALLVVIQFVPVDRSNPPVTADFTGPADVAAVLRTSCYDCHSNETIWPWYSRVAPVSFFVANHVGEGREHVNFSTWGDMAPGNRAHAVGEIQEVIAKGEMPLTGYVMLHSEAKLAPDELRTINAWATAYRPTGPAAGANSGTTAESGEEEEEHDS